MSYRNKTYVIFDGDNDIRYYRLMKAWKSNENIDFNFNDAHDLNILTDRASEDTVKQKLRERFSSAKQVIVLIGENTKNLYKFVYWEMEIANKLDLPIIAVNLNGNQSYDAERCPLILRDKYVAHVSYNAAIIQYALDKFPDEYSRRDKNAGGNRSYPESKYKELRL